MFLLNVTKCENFHCGVCALMVDVPIVLLYNQAWEYQASDFNIVLHE